MSRYGQPARPVDDLTARARIIDAALVQFGRSGGAATLRSIADAAGLSVGLVQHHFATKPGLREACDERVLAYLRLKVSGDQPEGGLTDPDFIGLLYDAATPLLPYLARVALETDERAGELFDEIATITAAWLTTHWPDRFPEASERRRDAASVMVAMSLGTVTYHHQLARAMGFPDGDSLPSPRVGAASVDAYRAVGDYLRSPLGAEITEAIDAHHDDQEHR